MHVAFLQTLLLAEVDSEAYANELHKEIELLVVVRGFSATSSWKD